MRRAARVLCVDTRNRILLLCWKDPVSGVLLWEPPGGGVEEGETSVEAARRELREETGLVADVGAVSVPVDRDAEWNGKRHTGMEEFHLARVDKDPQLSRDGLQAYETGWLVAHAWVSWDELDELDGRIEPPELLDVLARLDPTGPWAQSR